MIHGEINNNITQMQIQIVKVKAFKDLIALVKELFWQILKFKVFLTNIR